MALQTELKLSVVSFKVESKEKKQKFTTWRGAEDRQKISARLAGFKKTQDCLSLGVTATIAAHLMGGTLTKGDYQRGKLNGPLGGNGALSW